MLAGTVTFPREQFQHLATALREVKRTTSQQIVTEQFRYTIRDCISATPPFDKPSFGRFGHEVSLKAHEKIGKFNVRADIKKVLQPLKSLAVMGGRKRLAVALRKYASEGNVRAIKTILTRLHIPFEEVVVGNIQSLSALHNSKRNAKGRVKKSSIGIYVIDGKALTEYINRELDRVGLAKAGWATLAQYAGVTGLPNWITKHNAPAPVFDDKRTDPEKPQITFGNLVEFVDDFSDLEILDKVFRFRIEAMKTNLDKLIEANAKKELSKIHA